jgi:hypothetical protein
MCLYKELYYVGVKTFTGYLTLALSFTFLFGCGDENTTLIDPSTCRDCPLTVGANIAPNQDVAMAAQAENITITFNEPMAESNLNLIRLEVLGFKGSEVPLGANVFPDVPIATHLSPDKQTLTIDIDPDHDPNTPLDPGLVFAVTGFETLFGVNGKPFDASNPNNFLPAVQAPSANTTRRVLRFTTHAGAELLMLTAAPMQVPNTAQNSAPNFFPVARLDLALSTQTSSGARALRVFASPSGSVTNSALFCKVFESSFTEEPSRTISIPLGTIDAALNQCRRPLKNAQWDDGLMIDVAVAVVNADGEEGPRAPVITTKDNVQPRITGFSLLSEWVTGSQAGTFQIQIQFTEEMDKNTLTNPANYTISRSAGVGSYTVNAVTIPTFQFNPNQTGVTTINLTFTLTAGRVSNGDAITLSQAITDEAGNPLDPSANTLMVNGFTVIIGGAP